MSTTEFRQLQKSLDDAGIMTCINRKGRNKNRRYEVIVNMELKVEYKTRRSAKNYIIQLSGGGVLKVVINSN